MARPSLRQKQSSQRNSPKRRTPENQQPAQSQRFERAKAFIYFIAKRLISDERQKFIENPSGYLEWRLSQLVWLKNWIVDLLIACF